ncbi:DUF2637 domain-containing protein [Streptomyces sp. JV176]|uniref:DUF2637 domain-containing protein n=1 Tax=Streptomyces sp. JV176 TaxID=858630 RepID=UPI002E78885D|nr:DUF2637 domain-containing protein [Streptomyces sp. JV176]MEE1803478.1 DUF2637 domain-containing protein [Streptomyces sp. JV176]
MSHAHIDTAAGTERQGYNLRGMTAWDRSAIILLGAAGFAFSYDALRQIALAIHARENLSYLFPVFIDGFIAYGVRAIVLLRHQRFAARLYAWFLFLAATGASLGANALHAITLNDSPQAGRSALHLADSVVGVLSMLAPLALAGSVHLYILMARTAERAVPDGAETGPGPVREEAPALKRVAVQPRPRPLEAPAPMAPRPLTGCPSAPAEFTAAAVDLRKVAVQSEDDARTDDTAVHPSAEADDGETEGRTADGPVPGSSGQGPTGAPSPAADPAAPEAVRTAADGERPSVPDGAEGAQDRDTDDDWLAELLPIARAATERAGRTSREVVGDAVRKHQAISNDRLGVLLARLKEEDDEGAKTLAAASSALW